VTTTQRSASRIISWPGASELHVTVPCTATAAAAADGASGSAGRGAAPAFTFGSGAEAGEAVAGVTAVRIGRRAPSQFVYAIGAAVRVSDGAATWRFEAPAEQDNVALHVGLALDDFSRGRAGRMVRTCLNGHGHVHLRPLRPYSDGEVQWFGDDEQLAQMPNVQVC
jgi:hypothetical protein